MMNERPEKNIRWTGLSSGYYSVNRDDNSEEFVVSQRGQIQGTEVWLFAAFDPQLGKGITKYLQSHLFNTNLGENQVRRKAKEIVRKAYINSKAQMNMEERRNRIGGSTTVLVMNGKKFVAADAGGYKAVVCKDGIATRIGRKYHRKRQWAMSGLLHFKCAANPGASKHRKLVVDAQNVEPDTNFIILASDGIWEVMRFQEAVDLVCHIEDAQQAADCLAAEALARMTKAVISCIVIRFH